MLCSRGGANLIRSFRHRLLTALATRTARNPCWRMLGTHIGCTVPNRSDVEVEQSLGEVSLRCAPLSVSEISAADFFLPSTEDVGSDFLMINKPPDVRMNGDFSITVENIILHLRPDLRIEQLRWVHRLDFATSGVLLVALTREAAKYASIAFATRTTRKHYLAVLEGILDPSQWPLLDDSDTCTAHKKRQRVLATARYDDPRSSSFSASTEQSLRTWQDEARELGISASLAALKALHDKAGGSDKEVAEMVAYDEAHFLKDKRHRKAMRKLLKARGVATNLPISEASCFSGAAESEKQQRDERRALSMALRVKASEDEELEETLPATRIYRRVSSDGREILIVRVPLAEIEERFEVVPGSVLHPGKECETHVEIIDVGSYLGKAVTKVLFTPITGRRHQLRVHALSLGHSIVGDATYSPTYDPACERMMLHALTLALDLDDGYYASEGPRTLELRSLDPFPVVSGMLTPTLPKYVTDRIDKNDIAITSTLVT